MGKAARREHFVCGIFRQFRPHFEGDRIGRDLVWSSAPVNPRIASIARRSEPTLIAAHHFAAHRGGLHDGGARRLWPRVVRAVDGGGNARCVGAQERNQENAKLMKCTGHDWLFPFACIPGGVVFPGQAGGCLAAGEIQVTVGVVVADIADHRPHERVVIRNFTAFHVAPDEVAECATEVFVTRVTHE